MTTHRAIQLSVLIETLQTNRIRWYGAARKCAELGNKGGMKFFLAKAHKAGSIISRANNRFGSA